MDNFATYPDTPLEPATLERVVDGDTLIVRIDGQRERVRLAGINTPESVSPDEERNCAEGSQAASFVGGLLQPGQLLWLQRCASDRDDYNRLLRFVWMQQPNQVDSIRQIRTCMLNAQLVEKGFADPTDYAPDNALFELFSGLAHLDC